MTTTISRILVPIDFSSLSAPATAYAIALAKLCGAKRATLPKSKVALFINKITSPSPMILPIMSNKSERHPDQQIDRTGYWRVVSKVINNLSNYDG